jgi:hypothetical protein
MTTTETEEILEKIKDLDYIEGKNLSVIAKRNNFKKQLFINIAYKIRDANLNGAKKNQFSDFLFIGGDFISIYYKRGVKIKELF